MKKYKRSATQSWSNVSIRKLKLTKTKRIDHFKKEKYCLILNLMAAQTMFTTFVNNSSYMTGNWRELFGHRTGQSSSRLVPDPIPYIIIFYGSLSVFGLVVGTWHGWLEHHTSFCWYFDLLMSWVFVHISLKAKQFSSKLRSLMSLPEEKGFQRRVFLSVLHWEEVLFEGWCFPCWISL